MACGNCKAAGAKARAIGRAAVVRPKKPRMPPEAQRAIGQAAVIRPKKVAPKKVSPVKVKPCNCGK